jgi:hypothetical protein
MGNTVIVVFLVASHIVQLITGLDAPEFPKRDEHLKIIF